MSLGRNHILLYQNYITNRTVLAFRQSAFGTGGCDCLVGNLGVSLGWDFTGLVMIAGSAVPAFGPLFGAGGSSGHSPFAIDMAAGCTIGLTAEGAYLFRHTATALPVVNMDSEGGRNTQNRNRNRLITGHIGVIALAVRAAQGQVAFSGGAVGQDRHQVQSVNADAGVDGQCFRQINLNIRIGSGTGKHLNPVGADVAHRHVTQIGSQNILPVTLAVHPGIDHLGRRGVAGGNILGSSTVFVDTQLIQNREANGAVGTVMGELLSQLLSPDITCLLQQGIAGQGLQSGSFPLLIGQLQNLPFRFGEGQLQNAV